MIDIQKVYDKFGMKLEKDVNFLKDILIALYLEDPLSTQYNFEYITSTFYDDWGMKVKCDGGRDRSTNIIYLFLKGYNEFTIELIEDMLYYYKDDINGDLLQYNVLYGVQDNMHFNNFSDELKAFIDNELTSMYASKELLKILQYKGEE